MKYAAACLCLCGWLAWGATDPPEIVFDHAVHALAASDYASAEQGFQSVIRQQPENVGAIGNLGIVYARTHRAGEAIAAYQRALRLSPDDESILLNLGIVYLKQNLHGLALPYFARVVAIDSHNQQARQLLAVCRLYAGDAAQAIHDLEDLSAASPRDEQLLFLFRICVLEKWRFQEGAGDLQPNARRGRAGTSSISVGKSLLRGRPDFPKPKRASATCFGSIPNSPACTSN